ncbi:MAG TPA: hypothetical protein PKC23_09190 [Candidatus Desulfobacillus sp.]|mgnify:CR=1 FL=1|nr:hypothetical protein [Candidatus Desulfobacillus sp.]
MSAWTCPYDLNGVCQKVMGAACNPGMRGCILEGKVKFASEEKQEPPKPIKAQPAEKKPAPPPKRRLPF